MNKQVVHNCGRVIDMIYVDNAWWMELRGGPLEVEYCPFCGVCLGKDTSSEPEMELVIIEPRNGQPYLTFVSKLSLDRIHPPS